MSTSKNGSKRIQPQKFTSSKPNSKRTFKYKITYVYTYKKAIEIIEQMNMSATKKGKCWKIISTILENWQWHNKGEISCEYWRKTIGGNYRKIIDKLIDNGIIEVEKSFKNPELEYYSKKNNQCKRFKICDSIIESGISRFLVEIRTSKILDISDIEWKSTKVLRKLSINNLEMANQSVDDFIANDGHMEKVKVNEAIEEDRIELHYLNGLAQWQGTKNAIARAKSNGKDIIYNGQKYRIENIEKFNIKRSKNCELYYKECLRKIDEREGQAIRNSTNYRLDSRVTNMPSMLLKHCRLFGEPIKELDLANSQITILVKLIELLQKLGERIFVNRFSESYLLANNTKYPLTTSYLKKYLKGLSACNKILIFSLIKYCNSVGQKCSSTSPSSAVPSPSTTVSSFPSLINPLMLHSIVEKAYKIKDSASFKRFQSLTKKGQIYDYIQNQLNLGSREEAKTHMFYILFSARNNRSHTKKCMKKLFPDLVAFTDLFKEIFGDNQLAICLQQMESVIFIDIILSKLFKKGFKPLSKHDSILLRKSELNGGEAVIRGVLDEVFERGDYLLRGR